MTPYWSCDQTRAARTPMRCSANIAATSARSPTRSGAITVTREPSATGSTVIETPPRRTSLGTVTSSLETGGSAAPLVRAALVRRDRSRISPDRHDDQALGEAARASASVSTVSRSSASAEPSREASASTVAGSSGSRVVAVSASSRCQRTSSAISSMPDSSNPIRVAMLRAIGSPATLCSVRLPLPMSWSSAATISTSGRAT